MAARRKLDLVFLCIYDNQHPVPWNHLWKQTSLYKMVACRFAQFIWSNAVTNLYHLSQQLDSGKYKFANVVTKTIWIAIDI